MFFGVEAEASSSLCGIVTQGKGGEGVTHFVDDDTVKYHQDDSGV